MSGALVSLVKPISKLFKGAGYFCENVATYKYSLSPYIPRGLNLDISLIPLSSNIF